MSSVIESMNLHPDPRCLKMRSAWNGAARQNGEKWRYEAKASGGASVPAWAPMTNQELAGRVLYARITTGVSAVLAQLDVEKATTLVRQDGWIAARVNDGYVANHSIWLARGPFVLDEVGVYSPEDWERIYAAYQAGEIQYPWVAGPRDGGVGPWEL